MALYAVLAGEMPAAKPIGERYAVPGFALTESVEAAADFFSGEDFLSFKSLLAFEASSFLLFFSSLATLTTSRNVPVLAPGLCE